ncbi:glycosyltransferase [Cognatilysobacter lacus]|nr:glycosyltransferase [Lysobacter lacus]
MASPRVRSNHGGRPLRVLHVIPSVAAGSGGPSRAIAQIERVLSGSGVEVVTATTDDGGEGHDRDGSIGDEGAVTRCNGAIRHHFPLQTRAYKTSLPLLRWLRRAVPGFDVVHVHAVFSFAPVAAARVARSARVPYVIRPLGVLNRYGMTQRRAGLKSLSLRIVERPLLQDAAAVHFTSEQEREEAESLGFPMRSAVLPLGIDAAVAATPELLLQSFPQLRGRRRLLYLSRIDPKKNVEALLLALARVRATSPDVSLLVCGTGDASYLQRLRALAEQLGVADRVVWAGHVDGELKASAFAAADLFVLPSFSENFGIAPVEAVAAGVPCVLGEGVAVASRIDQAGAGIAVAPDAEAVAAAITRGLGDAEWRQRASANGRALAASDYSVEAMGRGLLDLYARIRSPGGRP